MTDLPESIGLLIEAYVGLLTGQLDLLDSAFLIAVAVGAVVFASLLVIYVVPTPMPRRR